MAVIELGPQANTYPTAVGDANGDGKFAGRVTDAVYLLTYNFLGGPPPPVQFPVCGVGAKAADLALGCGGTTGCP